MINKTYVTACQLIILFSYCRLFVALGIIGLVSPNINDFIFIGFGLITHLTATPYTGLKFSFKTLGNTGDFIPLKKWMISNGSRELSGHEYESINTQTDLSPLGQELLVKIKAQGKITVYDQVNLMLFEMQVGKPVQFSDEDEQLKKNYK